MLPFCSDWLQSDIMGDESKPSLYTLLLQPVQRIPEYLLLLQVRLTDALPTTFHAYGLAENKLIKKDLKQQCVAMTVFVQGLLKQTEAEHPDYYLLLVCIQQFRSFTAQYHHLLQHNQELLLHNRKEVKRSVLPDYRKIT